MELMQKERKESAVTAAEAAEKTVSALYALGKTEPETLLMLGALLEARGCTGQSTLYLFGEGSFYLAIEEKTGKREGIAPTAVLAEFGTRLASPAMLSLLAEHGRCLIRKRAVPVLAAISRGDPVGL